MRITHPHEFSPTEKSLPQVPSNGHAGPPAYSTQDPLADSSVDLEAAFSSLSFSATSDRLPTADECIAHLKLLEAFKTLREKIRNQDDVFGISDSVALDDESRPPTEPAALTQEEYEAQMQRYQAAKAKYDEKLEAIRERRWAIYLARACYRYTKWFKSEGTMPGGLYGGYREMLRQSDVLNSGTIEGRITSAAALSMSMSLLPPLDVLMVWHSHRLNPRAYLEDCLRKGRYGFWKTPFPWRSVDSVIHNQDFSYSPPDEAVAGFIQRTECAWSNIDDPSTREVQCTSCNNLFQVRYTNLVPIVRPNSETGQYDLEERGFCGANFQATCPNCSVLTTHAARQIHKFQADARNLKNHNCPMPGTILTFQGKAESAQDTHIPEKYPATFPNRLLESSVFNLVVAVKAHEQISFAPIRDIIERAIATKSIVKSTDSKGSRSSRLLPGEQIAIRRMMSHYWENDGPFALDLVGAVVRQGSFIDKMHDLDWLHSPALRNTAIRSITKYQRFFMIMREFKKQLAVPTLDVDWIWHTNQLSPQCYYKYSIEMADRFVDHDDKIAEGKLSEAFAATSRAYFKLYKESYSACNCWYCEALREGTAGVFHTETSVPGAPTDINLGPHVSAHNAVRGGPKEQNDTKMVAKRVIKWTEANRNRKFKAEQKKQKGKTRGAIADPVAEEATSRGGPVIPPYAAMYYTPGFYPAYPACMSTAQGSIGNCAAGTCGGTIAQGGCAGGAGACSGGVTSGGCAGGNGGGCGGSGGGCGGGGGGCGGGCGG